MEFKSEILELRGAVKRTTKAGTDYLMVNVEDSSGSPYQFYCKDLNAINGFKKGDQVYLVCEYSLFDGHVRMVLQRLERRA